MKLWDYPQADAISPMLSGLYRIDHAAYHAGEGISSSDIKNALISYGHYQARKAGKAGEDTPAKAFGRAFHMALLEPHLFRERFVVSPKLDRRTKEGKNDYEAWAIKANGKEVLNADDMSLLELMRSRVTQHPLWSSLVDYNAEIMGIVTDEKTGLLLKCKADLFGSTIVDIKTAECATKTEFRSACMRWGYHISAAFYQDIYARITSKSLPFVHVVVEKKEPFGVAFYEMSPEFLEEGRKLYRAGIERLIRWSHMDESRRQLNYGDAIQTLYPTASVIYKTLDILSEIESEI